MLNGSSYWKTGIVHSLKSSSFQETYHKGMVHHWLLEEYIHSNQLDFKKHITKGWYIFGIEQVHSFQNSDFFYRNHMVPEVWICARLAQSIGRVHRSNYLLFKNYTITCLVAYKLVILNIIT